MRQFLDRLVHRLDRRRRERLGDVADAAADDVRRGCRIRVAKFLHPPGDLGKEIAGLELEVIFVEISHGCSGGL